MTAPRLDITVVIPTHSARVANGMLDRALKSVTAQTYPAAAVSVAVDLNGQGAAATRQRALDAVRTEWVAYLDSDDWFYPDHLKTLAAGARVYRGADVLFSYYMVHAADGPALPHVDPLGHFGKAFDPARPHQTTIVTLERTDLAKAVGFREPPAGALVDGQRYGEDFQHTVELVKAGARIVHIPRRTWAWVHHSGNSSGQPDRGDAKRST
ncbi:glycosyl transferase family 2 [Streptomyces sp. Amel2xB2]|uniref:glycosyltransferase family 2 protein n=1 Tax=Streptomyces sp. Amel2xB2 TaxID=1305829 RepID=UPI000DBFF28F|nr:glycosyltransferase family 2 protein [Streptomyces sp. Amel2xB2]RAJ70291.1 glycosyl transferase family 2 [Streptomyces sp. Amel2xB2]